MKRKFAAASIGSALLISQFAVANVFAEEKKNNESELQETVVTANRYETPTDEIGSSVTVISSKEIDQSKKTTIQEVIRNVPGLDVVQTGGPGGTTSVFMRGAEARHTLILMDGIELGDSSAASGEYNLAHLTTDNIERIEVLRGPQSTLYGSQAMGGVINIITKRGKGKPAGFLSAEGGSYYTAKERAGVSGGTDLFNYSLGASRFDSGGFSQASEKYGNVERDGYQNTAFNTKLGITPLSNLNIDFILNYNKNRLALDNSGGRGGDDPNYFAWTEQFSFRSQTELSLFNDMWLQKLGVSYMDFDRDYKNDYDATHPSSSKYNKSASTYHGQSVKLDWQHILNLHKTNTVTFGVDRKEENMKSNSRYGADPISYSGEKYISTTGVFFQDQVRLWDAWFTTAGVRVDDNSQFGTQVTYRFTTAYDLKKTGTTFKGSYGTGFKAPTMFQLYDPRYGVNSLRPETSSGWDVGVEQAIPAVKTVVGATYFYNDFSDLIVYTYNSAKYYDNIAKARTQGVETFVTVKPLDCLTVKGSYTYTRAIDTNTGNDLPRRPKNKFSLNTNYSFLNKKGNLNVAELLRYAYGQQRGAEIEGLRGCQPCRLI